MCFSFQWWPAQHDSLATVRLYQNWIGFNLADRQKRSVLADPILWYNGYLGGLGSTLGGTRVLSS